MRPHDCVLLVLAAVLLAGCGEDAGTSVRRGCTPDHDAAGTYRFSPTYVEGRLMRLEEAYLIEERPFDREVMRAFVDGMQEAWANAVLVLASDGTFRLSGVALPDFEPSWEGTWEVRIDPCERKLLLSGGGEELHALLGDGWTIPWIEEPQPGVVLDVLLARDDAGSE